MNKKTNSKLHCPHGQHCNELNLAKPNFVAYSTGFFLVNGYKVNNVVSFILKMFRVKSK